MALAVTRAEDISNEKASGCSYFSLSKWLTMPLEPLPLVRQVASGEYAFDPE